MIRHLLPSAYRDTGLLLAIGIWAGGAGLTLLVQRNARAGLGEVLIPAFPLSLALLALYHVLWVVYILTLLAMWPVKFTVMSGK